MARGGKSSFMGFLSPAKRAQLEHWQRSTTIKEVREWLQSHPRFVLHFSPVPCSWLNRAGQWFSMLQRKRLRITDFASNADLQAKLVPRIAEWNAVAHPFNWTTKSVAKVMADAIPAAA
jgi:hypothetical protein